MKSDKPTVCVDFDGVIRAHSKLTQGARQAILHLCASYRVVILSSRAIEPVGKAEIAAWLEARDIEVDEITAEKVDAVAYIDDKAIRFRGNWAEVLGKLETSRPWWTEPVEKLREDEPGLWFLGYDGTWPRNGGACIRVLHDRCEWATGNRDTDGADGHSPDLRSAQLAAEDALAALRGPR